MRTWVWAVLVYGVVGIAIRSHAEAPPNLIVNGDAEGGVGSSDGYMPVAIPSWTVTGGPNVVQWAVGNGFPDVETPGPTNRGLNYFTGGTGDPIGTLSQTIDVSTSATEIDAGTAPFTLCGFLGGYLSQSDKVVVVAEFLDGAAGDLGSASIGPVLAEDRASMTALCLESTSGTVPSGARAVNVTVTFTRINGAYGDGYADNLNFLLAPSCPETGGCGTPTTTSPSTSTSTSTIGTPTTSSTSTTTATTSSTVPSTVASSTSTPDTTLTTTSTTDSSTTTVASTSITTSSSTTAAPPTTTTSSTTAVPTTVTTSSTTAAPSTTTTSTAVPATVTTTTIAPEGCTTTAATFASVLCRLDALADDVASATDLGTRQAKLAALVDAARANAAQADTAPSTGKRKARLAAAAKKLAAFVHRLSSRGAQKAIPEATRTRLATVQATPLRADVLTLRRNAT